MPVNFLDDEPEIETPQGVTFLDEEPPATAGGVTFLDEEPAAPAPERGTLSEIGSGLMRGVGGMVSSLGGLVRMLPSIAAARPEVQLAKALGSEAMSESASAYETAGASIAGAGEKLSAAFPQSGSIGETEFSNPSWWAAKLPEVVPQLAAQLGAAAATGGGSVIPQIATFGVMGGGFMAGDQYNDSYEARIAAGETPEMARDSAIGEATLVGTVGAALDAIPGMEFLSKNPVVRGIVGKVIKNKIAQRGVAGFLSEGLPEAMQEAVSDVAAANYRDDAERMNGAWKRWLSAGLLGGITGAAVDVGMGKIDDAKEIGAAKAIVEGSSDSPLYQAHLKAAELAATPEAKEQIALRLRAFTGEAHDILERAGDPLANKEEAAWFRETRAKSIAAEDARIRAADAEDSELPEYAAELRKQADDLMAEVDASLRLPAVVVPAESSEPAVEPVAAKATEEAPIAGEKGAPADEVPPPLEPASTPSAETAADVLPGPSAAPGAVPSSSSTAEPTKTGGRVVSTALRDADGKILIVGEGPEAHASLITRAAKEGIDATEAERVFVDEGGTVLTRTEAAARAKESGQIDEAGFTRAMSRGGIQQGLQSEDIRQPEVVPAEPDTVAGAEVVEGAPIISVPVKDLVLSEDVPQFKKGSDRKGVVKPLEGEYEPTGNVLQVWKRKDGRMEVISGRHRFDLAQRTGTDRINVQVHDEAAGFDALRAARLDAELNIREGQGSTADYANYFRHAEASEGDAESKGLLGNAKGKAGFRIGKQASDDVFALHQAGELTDSQAEAVAESAPNNPSAQRIGTRAALDGKSAADVRKIMGRSLSRSEGGEAQQLDLLGSDDSAMKQMEEEAKIASAAQRDIRKRIQAIEGASKNPKMASAEGVDVRDPEAVQKRVAELKEEENKWDRYWEHPELLKQAGGETVSTESETKETVAETKTAALPTLRAGEKQGDLMSTQTEDFALVGEKGVDQVKAAEEKSKAETDAAEAARIQDEQQARFFSYNPVRAPGVEIVRSPEHFRDIFRVIEAMKRTVKGLKVRVLRNESELPVDVKAQIRADAWHEGLVDTRTGDVWILSDHIRNAQRAAEVFAHEVIGHYGVERVVRAHEWKGISDSIFKNHAADAKAIATKYAPGKELSALTEEERSTIAKEYIARLAENPQMAPTLWRRIVMAIRAALKRWGIARDWSDDEIQTLLKRATQEVQRAPESVSEGLRASLAEKPFETSTKNAVQQQERDDRGADPILKEAVQSNAETFAKAQTILDADPEAGRALIDGILNGSHPTVSDVDEAILLSEKVRLMNERNAVGERIADQTASPESRMIDRQQWDVLEAQIDRLDRATAMSGTIWGRMGQFRQRLMRQDYSFTALERRARMKLERPLKSEESEIIRKQAKEIEDLQAKLDEFEKARDEQESREALDAMIADLRRQIAAEAARPKVDPRVMAYAENVVKGWEEAAVGAAERLRNRFGTPNSSLRASIGETPEASRAALDPEALADVVTIAKAKIGRGLSDFAKFESDTAAQYGEGIRPYLKDAWETAQTQLEEVGKELPKLQADRVKKTLPKTPEAKRKAIADSMKALMGEEGAELGDLRRLVGKLSLEFVRSGITEREALLDAVHSELQAIVPSIERRTTQDLISGYGDFSPLDPEAAKATLRDIKGQLQQTGKLEDLIARRPLQKTGVQRREVSDAERRLIRAVNEAKKKYGVVTTNPAAQLKGAMDAVKTRLRNQIKDLTNRFETGVRPPNKTPLEYDEESKALKALRDRLSATLSEIEGTTDMTDEQRVALVKKSLESQIAEYERRIRESDTSPKGKGSKLSTPELDAMRARRDALREEFKEMQLLDADLQDRLALQRDAAAIEQTRQSIADLDRRIATGDLSVRTSGKREGSDELQKLRAERDTMSKYLAKLRREALPRKTAEEIALQSLKARMTARTAELKEKLASGDFKAKPKTNVALDKEALDLKFGLETAKRAYNEGLLKWKMDQRSKLGKAGGALVEALNTSRAVLTSFDLSGVLRQGGFTVFSHPVRSAKALPALFKAFQSEKKQFAINAEIQKRPNATSGLYKDSGLYLADPDSTSLHAMEEAYMSRWVKKIPRLAGGGFVRGSERAYTTFLNQLRADSFDELTATLSKDGKPTLDEAKAIANFVNVTTGRGDLGRANAAAVALNTVFFAPRYVASRFQTLLGQPLYSGTARTKKLVAGEYARFLTGAALVYSMLVAAQDDEDKAVEVDPRSSDFGKVRYGDTRVDPMSGLLQSTILLSRLATRQTKKASGEIVGLSGDTVPFGGANAYDVLTRFARTKFSPAFGTAIDIESGKNVIGEPVTKGSVLMNMTVPISMRDILDTLKSQGVPATAALTVLSLFGMGVQTYAAREAANMERDRIKKRLERQGRPVSEQEIDYEMMKADYRRAQRAQQKGLLAK